MYDVDMLGTFLRGEGVRLTSWASRGSYLYSLVGPSPTEPDASKKDEEEPRHSQKRYLPYLEVVNTSLQKTKPINDTHHEQ